LIEDEATARSNILVLGTTVYKLSYLLT